ncbi:hypothetical protein VNO80_33226 [Phaseolus coccineus]|uniref:Glycosyl hydrolase family 95 catalytic domain-containing protein n=1 Tax=Phaseolus coccineus TaxID=3886 RepID=A0AAN9Q8H4_PHACN
MAISTSYVRYNDTTPTPQSATPRFAPLAFRLPRAQAKVDRATLPYLDRLISIWARRIRPGNTDRSAFKGIGCRAAADPLSRIIRPLWPGFEMTIKINTEMNTGQTSAQYARDGQSHSSRMCGSSPETGRERPVSCMALAAGYVTTTHDIWRATAPIDGPQYGLWPMGGARLCASLGPTTTTIADSAYLESVYPIFVAHVSSSSTGDGASRKQWLAYDPTRLEQMAADGMARGLGYASTRPRSPARLASVRSISTVIRSRPTRRQSLPPPLVRRCSIAATVVPLVDRVED